MEFWWNSKKLKENFNQYSDQKIRWPKEFLWNSRKLQENFNQYSDQKIRWPRNCCEIQKKIQEKFNQYSDQKIRWPRNPYEILENYRKSLDIPKIPTSAYSSKSFSSLFNYSIGLRKLVRQIGENILWIRLNFYY